MNENKAIAKIEDGNLVIKMPVKLLIHAEQNNPEFFKVKIIDKEKFVNEVASRFIEFDEDPDTGLSRFYQMLDDITEEIIEDGNDCIKAKLSPDDDWE